MGGKKPLLGQLPSLNRVSWLVITAVGRMGGGYRAVFQLPTFIFSNGTFICAPTLCCWDTSQDDFLWRCLGNRLKHYLTKLLVHNLVCGRIHGVLRRKANQYWTWCIAEDDPELLLILLPLPPTCWHHGCALPCPLWGGVGLGNRIHTYCVSGGNRDSSLRK